MALPLQGFTDYVRMQAAAVQGAATAVLDLTVGSALRSILEANAALALWLQWLAAQVLAATRAATSQGADLDSWMADFGVTRLPASQAAGQVVFSRFAATIAALVPTGAQARASTTGQLYTVQSDPTNAAWTGRGIPASRGHQLGLGASGGSDGRFGGQRGVGDGGPALKRTAGRGSGHEPSAHRRRARRGERRELARTVRQLPR